MCALTERQTGGDNSGDLRRGLGRGGGNNTNRTVGGDGGNKAYTNVYVSCIACAGIILVYPSRKRDDADDTKREMM